jgi:outer membrane protein assembly factor BamB
VGIAADTGKLLWKGARHGETAVIPTPVFKNGEVFVTSGYNAGCNLFKITASSGNFSAKQVYANPHMSVHHGGVILLGDYIYGSADPGILTCMDFKTGKIKWKDRSVGKGSLTCADGKLYLRAESGTVALVEATPDGYHPISQFDQPDRSDANAWPHAVVADGKLYLRDQDLLFCYDVKQK